MHRRRPTVVLLLLLSGATVCTAWLLRPPLHVARHPPSRRAAAPRAQAGGIEIADWLRDEDRDRSQNGHLDNVVLALFESCRTVSKKIATAACDSTSCFSDIGASPGDEELLAIDLLAEEVLFAALERTGGVSVASSESDNVLRSLAPFAPTPPADGRPSPPLLSVSLDPIDASSIIDANFAVGTIFGVWESPSLLNVTGRTLVAAGACTYGPRTAITLALADRPAVHEFLLVGERWLKSNVRPMHAYTCASSRVWHVHCMSAQVGERWLKSNVYGTMMADQTAPPGGRGLFAPGNLRATATNAGYAELVAQWQRSKYTLRYTGGLVPDVTQLMVKGRGVFTSAAGEDHRHTHAMLHAPPARHPVLRAPCSAHRRSTHGRCARCRRGRAAAAAATL